MVALHNLVNNRMINQQKERTADEASKSKADAKEAKEGKEGKESGKEGKEGKAKEGGKENVADGKN